MQNFRKLIAWQKAHELVLLVYKMTKSFPKEEKYNLTSQFRRAAVSVPTNIAEGCGKFTKRDFANFLQTSQGSAQEVEYLAFLSRELKYLNDDNYKELDKLVNETKAILISLITKVRGTRDF